jgi:tetratricopeptide (TPR) repeat protein
MRVFFITVLVLSLGSLVSCSEWQEGVAIIQGNGAYQRGEFQKASLSYLSVQDSSAADIVNYNLGNVYNALGETNTAMAVWSRIVKPGSEELAYRLAFNRGYLQYQRGQYDDAVKEFRTALLMKPSSLDAKRNLEICLLKTQSFGSALPARSRTDRSDPSEPQKALLDYINRLEGTRWKANNHYESAPSSVDW